MFKNKKLVCRILLLMMVDAIILMFSGPFAIYLRYNFTWEQQAIAFIEYMEDCRMDLSWCVYSLDEWIVKDKSDPRIIHEENEVKAQAMQGTVDSAANDEINKILCICGPGKIWEIESKLKEKFPQYSIVKSSDILLEIMESGITKETAVRTLCSLWDIPLSNAAAFGDNYNDVEMLEAVGSGILMGNAPEELKKRIPMQTEDNEHDGIYAALVKMGWIEADGKEKMHR